MPMLASETSWRTRLRALRPSSRPAALMMPRWYATPFVDSLLFVASALERCGVRYIAQRGTLLGAVRLHGVLPWDDDADLFVIDENAASLEAKLGPTLRAHGFAFTFREREYYFWAHPQTIWRRPFAGLTEIGLLTASRAASGAVVFDAHAPHRMLTAERLLPLTAAPFYSSYLWAPRDSEGVLQRYYGELAAPAALARFERPAIDSACEAFWRRARPLGGSLDWPAISARFQARAHSARFQLAQGPCTAFWIAGRAQWIAADALRALAEL